MRVTVRRGLAAGAAAVLALVPLGAAEAVTTEGRAGKIVHFTSPSGNIDCFLSSDKSFGRFANCFVQEDRWKSHKPRPASCDLDWEPAEVTLSRNGKVNVGACRGDVGALCTPGADGLQGCSTLRYGATVTAGKIRCASTRKGITCRTTDGARHGFRVSSSGLRLF